MSIKLVATITGNDETVKVYRDTEWEEYRVRVVGGPAGSAYHTDDLDDAMGTARMLAGQSE